MQYLVMHNNSEINEKQFVGPVIGNLSDAISMAKLYANSGRIEDWYTVIEYSNCRATGKTLTYYRETNTRANHPWNSSLMPTTISHFDV
jgi:hypothetical protein